MSANQRSTAALVLLKQVAIVGAFSTLLLGCEKNDLTDFKSQLNSALTGAPGGGGLATHELDTVGLRNILPEFDDTKPLSQQFPHVALYVLSSPPNWAAVYDPSRRNNGCFTFQAVVWSNAKDSRKTNPFNYCPDVDADFSLGPAYLYTLTTPMSEVATDYLTGNRRTEGPRPPSRLLPTDNRTQDLIAKNNSRGNVTDLNADISTKLAVTFANIRRQIGANLSGSTTSDFRVWIVNIADAVK